MEFGSDKNAQDKVESSPKIMGHKTVQPEATMTETPKQHSSDNQEVRRFKKHVPPAPTETAVDVNMEVSVTPDEVMSVGGFGAKDDIISFLPVASDFTDFGAHIHEGQDLDKETPRGQTDLSKNNQDNTKDIENVKEDVASAPKDVFGEVDEKASVISDEVTRAGGFGARDDISSFLPVASDFTDFEAHLRDARDYEDLNEVINRPGLGWSKDETKSDLS